jgi:hypothetical protein
MINSPHGGFLVYKYLQVYRSFPNKEPPTRRALIFPTGLVQCHSGILIALVESRASFSISLDCHFSSRLVYDVMREHRL